MRDTFKNRVQNFVFSHGRAQKRKFYIDAFVDMGMKPAAASLYHYLHVTKVKKTIQLKKSAVARDPATGRFVKRAA